MDFKSIETKEKALLQLNSQVNEKTKQLQNNFNDKIQEILAVDEEEVPQKDLEASDFLEKYQEQIFNENNKDKPDLLTQITKAKATENLAFLQEIHELNEIQQSKEKIIASQKDQIANLEAELNKIANKVREKDSLIAKMHDKGKVISEESKRFVKEITILNEKIEGFRKEKDIASEKNENFKQEIAKINQKRDQIETENKDFVFDLTRKEEKIKYMERFLEENKLKIKEQKIISIEEKERNNKEREKLLSDQKKLLRQKNELLTVFKKMNKLIEILKKQRTHLETAGSLGFTEEEFIKALDLPEKLIG